MTELVAIVNVTPDSFAGGSVDTPDAALWKAEQALAEGAAILDIGAESTRPGATPLKPEEEWQRLEPALALIRKRQPNAVISLDTRHAETVRRALPFGIAWVNDVSGFTDPAMVDAVKDTDCKLVVMHSLGAPADKRVTMSESRDPVPDVRNWLRNKMHELEACGIARERIIADPGLGFGKTARQSLAIAKRVAEFKSLEVELMVGHSEKSFLSLFTDKPAGERGAETQKFSAYFAWEGVDYLRVHDVEGNKKAIETALGAVGV